MPSSPEPRSGPIAGAERSPWIMLLALVSASRAMPTFTAVFVTVAAMLATGTTAFAWSPKPDTGASR